MPLAWATSVRRILTPAFVSPGAPRRSSATTAATAATKATITTNRRFEGWSIGLNDIVSVPMRRLISILTLARYCGPGQDRGAAELGAEGGKNDIYTRRTPTNYQHVVHRMHDGGLARRCARGSTIRCAHCAGHVHRQIRRQPALLR